MLIANVQVRHAWESNSNRGDDHIEWTKDHEAPEWSIWLLKSKKRKSLFFLVGRARAVVCNHLFIMTISWCETPATKATTSVDSPPGLGRTVFFILFSSINSIFVAFGEEVTGPEEHALTLSGTIALCRRFYPSFLFFAQDETRPLIEKWFISWLASVSLVIIYRGRYQN